MNMRSILAGLVAMCAGLPAVPAAVPWSNPSGNLGSYSFDSGQSTSGNFGDGSSSLEGFTFAPANFVASANGSASPAGVTDTASVVVHTVAPFWGVSVDLLGDFSILGPGTVNAFGTVKITDLDSANVYTLPLSMSGVSASNTAAGEFSGMAFLLAVINSPSNAKIEVSATLIATAVGNSTPLIQIKDAEIQLLLAPEPTSLTTVLVAAAVSFRRRRG